LPVARARRTVATIDSVDEKTPAPADAVAKVHHLSGLKVAVLWLLGMFLRAWVRTLRMQVDRQQVTAVARDDAPAVFVLWHNRLFFTTRLLRLFRSDRPVAGLISASRDGAVFAKFVSFLGVRPIRGSSSRFGREAVHSLINELRAGYDVVVTPDGPRGPMYDMKPGALLAARRARAPIVLVGVECRRCWTLRSWDRFRIPWPFARMIVTCERIELATLETHAEPLVLLRERLVALNGDAVGV
jgi:hypothetical protein